MSPCLRNRAEARSLFEARFLPLTGSTNAELNPRSLPRGLLETEVDLRAVKPEVSQLPAIEMAQHRQRGVTLATRDCRRHQAIDKTARARQKHGGSAPGNWRGSGGQNVFKHRHRRILSSGWRDLASLQRCGDSLNLPDPETQDFQRGVIYRPDALEICRRSQGKVPKGNFKGRRGEKREGLRR